MKGREEILKVHAKGKPLSEEIDLKQIAQTTAGFTGADLENLLNEAAILVCERRESIPETVGYKRGFCKSRNRSREEEPYYFRERTEDHGIP